mmetsp:Transcript_5052/g.7132  ORF Transcript_5052/g.7132 Transcript_5052/m.7132 type:complete len:90 (-) Transcript_5052:1095-1364(-)
MILGKVAAIVYESPLQQRETLPDASRWFRMVITPVTRGPITAAVISSSSSSETTTAPATAGVQATASPRNGGVTPLKWSRRRNSIIQFR